MNTQPKETNTAEEYLRDNQDEALLDVAGRLYPDDDAWVYVTNGSKHVRVDNSDTLIFNPLINPAQRLELQDAYRKDLLDDKDKFMENKRFEFMDAAESATTQLIAYMELHGINGDKS